MRSPQDAITRGCTATGISGVPVGAQTAKPVWMARGWPIAITRIAPTIHCPVTQGPPETGGHGHSAIPYGAEIVATGWPLPITRGTGTVGTAWPPCAHSTTAPT